jgi:iron complex transport system ATP-binding protein
MPEVDAAPASDRAQQAPLIEIRNATVYRGDTRVFRHFDLEIAERECIAIVGPNGAGKSTLLKLLNRELYPVQQPEAAVRILGRERWDVWRLRSRLGIVSDDLERRYANRTTASDVVLSGFFASVGVQGRLAERVDDDQREAARRVLDELGLASLADTPIASMSTGERRRCLLARALVHDPATLVLDEPTAGLDLAARFDLVRRLGALARGGRGIVLVTHRLDDIPVEIRRAVVLRAGRIVADGPPEAVFNARTLSTAYGTAVRVTAIDGRYLVSPAPPAAPRARKT